jgi:hypothetical protein
MDKIAFPGKMSKSVEKYKNLPIWVRALQSSKLNKEIGERFYWLYIKEKSIGKQNVPYYYFNETKLATKTAEAMLAKAHKGETVEYRKKSLTAEEIIKGVNVQEREEDLVTNVWAFDEETKNSVPEIDLDKMTERNIINKVSVIYEAMGWKNE